MPNHYTQLQTEERALIQTRLEQGFKLRAIARSLNRAASTVCRELRRNAYVAPSGSPPVGRPPLAGGYRYLEANQRACRLRRAHRVTRRMVMETPLWDSVLHG